MLVSISQRNFPIHVGFYLFCFREVIEKVRPAVYYFISDSTGHKKTRLKGHLQTGALIISLAINMYLSRCPKNNTY